LSDGIVVNGHIEAEFHGECRRCLQPVGSQRSDRLGAHGARNSPD
jgi:uncharacterized metal-binding protein YceD (DUF177 family)